MPEASITYGSYAFHDHGAALYGLTRRYENAENGKPTAIVYEFTIEVAFETEAFADTEAKLRALRAYLDANPEATLVIRDENDATVHNRTVRVTGDTLPADWRQYLGRVTVSFTARDHTLADAAADASWTPTGGTAITLPNITSYRESIATDYANPSKAYRRESRETIETAGTLSADGSLSESDRRAWLIAQKQAIQVAADTATGTLAFGGQERALQVDRFEARLVGDGSHQLEWSASFYRIRFPEDDYAEAEFETSTSTSEETGDVTLTVSGTIRATNEAAADTKLAAIRAYYGTARALLGDDQSDRRHHGSDSAAEDDEDLSGAWLERSFTLRYRDTNASVLNWELKITTRDDERTGLRTISYSGRVIASTSAAALAKARELGDGKHDFTLSSNEGLAYRKMGDGDSQRFTECDFSYDYQARTATLFAEVSSQTTRDRFGAWTITVSGSVVAADSTTAQSRGQAFKLGSGYLQTGDNETIDTAYLDPDGDEHTQFQRFSFSYTYLIPSSALSIEYSQTTSRNFETLETAITYEGIVRGLTEGACASYLASILSAPSGGRKIADVITVNYKRTGGVSVLDGYRFTWAYIADITSAEAPATIIEAEVSVDRTYSVDHAVITPIPFGSPHVQPNAGVTPGAVRISGQVTGFSESALRTWARAKRSLATGSAYADPPNEVMTEVYRKWRTTEIKLYRMSFNYPYRYGELNM